MKTTKLFDCIDAYTACFASVEEGAHYRRFEDDKLPDMYYYNLLVLEHYLGLATTQRLILAELARRQAAQKPFCLVQLQPAPDWQISQLELPLEPEIDGCVVCVSEAPAQLQIGGNRECVIKRITTPQMAEHNTQIEMAHYEDPAMVDFGQRKGRRNAQVFLQSGGVDGYLCYDGAQPVGRADLLVQGDWGMIENLGVIPQARHRGFATALLRELVAEALARGAQNILLDCNAADTPRQMYRNLGFVEQIGRSSLFFDLSPKN